MDTQDSWTDQRQPISRNPSIGETVSTSGVFLTTEFTQRLDLVRHLAANSERIPLLRGEHGIGKSTLLGVLIQQAPANWEVLCIRATPMLQQDQLIYELCRRFSTQQVNLESVEQLVEMFTELRKSGRMPVIIVDDCEQLPVSTLMELFSIFSRASGQPGGLALILFASPLIDDLLEETRLHFASDKLQLLELSPLNRDQSHQFVRHLFKVLAGQQELSISNEGYERIYRAAGGLPGKISQQVEKMLQPATITPAAFAKKRLFLPQLLSDVSAPVLIGGVILALLLLLTLIYEDEINAVFESDGTSSGETGVESVKNRRVIPLTLPDKSMNVERDTPAEPKEGITAELTGNADNLDEKIAKPVLPLQPLSSEKSEPPPVIEVTLPQLTALQPTNDTGESQSAEQLSEEPVIPDLGMATEADNSADSATSTKAPEEDLRGLQEVKVADVAPKEVAPPATPHVPEIKAETKTSSPAPVTELGQTKKLESKNVPEPITLMHKRKIASPAAVQEVGTRRESWLLKQSSDSYTLQLIGLGDEQAVTDFMRLHKLEGNTAYFRTKINGRPWFPVLYGIYPNRDAAVAARSKLPRDLAQEGIWPRSLASIQQAIKGE